MEWFDRQKAFSLISNQEQCRRLSPSQTSDTPRTEHRISHIEYRAYRICSVYRILIVIFLTSVCLVLWHIHATFNVMFYLQIMTNLWKLKYQKSNKNYFWLQDDWYPFPSPTTYHLHHYTWSIPILNAYWPISGQCSNFLPPGNTRKPLVFWCFQGV